MGRGFESLEGRALLATFSVTSLADAGPGTLRAAILAANAAPGADEIDFGTAGTISLRSALPGITDPVTIAGDSAPGFVTAPVVTVNFADRPGLRFLPGSDGSTLTSLALVRASGAGVTIDAPRITLTGNYIGTLANGLTAAGNTGDGVSLTARSTGSRIGLETSISYDVTATVPASGGGTLPINGWQGLTTAGQPGQYLITGTTTNPNDSSQTAGLLYQGPLSAEDGVGYVMVMPDPEGLTTDGTTAYSADNLGNGLLRIVGTYSVSGAPNELGFLFQGTVADVGTAANYRPIPRPHPSASWNIPHSTSGGLVVGNYDSSTSNGIPAGGGLAYVYDAVNRRYLVPSMVYPGSASNTAYGIWHNGGTSYTICGGFANSPINNLLNPRVPLSQALLVDFDSATGQFSNWKSFSYTTPSGNTSGIMHFEGISGVEPGKYTLAAVAMVDGVVVPGFATVYRNADGSFGEMQWTDLAPPVVNGAGMAFADSVYGNLVVGINPAGNGAGVTAMNAYQATVVPQGNLISGNRGNGVVVAGSGNTVAANTIGLTVAGNVALPNAGDGVKLLAGATANIIGRVDPVTGISYANTVNSGTTVTGWQGLRAAATAGDYLFAGTSGDDGLLYVGPINADGGTPYTVVMPDRGIHRTQSTSVYGPDLLQGGSVRLVGSYVDTDSSVRYGFLYEGPMTTSGFSTAGNYRTIRPLSNPDFTYVHSTMGGLAVGNCDTETRNGQPIGPGRAFIYDVARNVFVDDVQFPGAASNTAYGIWWNGGTSYTICGGYSLAPINNLASEAQQNLAIGQAYLVDYDSATRTFTNWQSFVFPNGPANVEFVTHFEGISSVEKGVYTLAATSLQVGDATNIIGSFVSIRRNTNGSFGNATWVDVSMPSTGVSLMTSVYGNATTGIALGGTNAGSFQATINTAAQLSNLIGGNGGNGVGLYGATANQVAMNAIGASFTGTAAVPNRGNGILVTNRASGNLIGGQATGGNSPVSYNGSTPVFVRPPQGNLISGNRGNGVLITGNATGNALSGNFVGTTPSGTSPLGNGQDGVAIVNASGNSLIGTTFPQNPFVFYNVLSGNAGNGLRITNSNDTTVWANFMGLGANNASMVPNGGDGLLVSGTSQRTLVGGPIPLGNGISGNNRHGIELRDSVGSFTSFNTFAGLYAFGGAAPNRLNGIEITATGGNNLIRTSLVAGNFGNGIHIGGRATGVQIEDTATGTNSSISQAVPNYGSGILIDGNASGNVIGGMQPSVETRVHLSGNLRYGLEIQGRARNNRIVNSTIGAGFVLTNAIPNTLGGIFIGAGTSGTTVGGTQPIQSNAVLFNTGAGITIVSSTGNVILGNLVGSNLGGGLVMSSGRNNRIGSTGGGGNSFTANGLNGIYVTGSSKGSVLVGNSIIRSQQNGLLLNAVTDLLVGGTLPYEGNGIVTSVSYGVLAVGNCARTKLIRNTVVQNTAGNVNLSGSTGITYVA